MAFAKEENKPFALVPKRWILLSTLGVAVFSFAPIVELAFRFFDAGGFYIGLVRVLGEFEIGQAYVLTFVIIVMFYLFAAFLPVQENKQYTAIALFFVLLMIFSHSAVSHAATLSPLGMLYHAAHVLAMCLWSGVLFLAGWLAKDTGKWLRFLKWYTPLAITSVFFVAFTGFLLMTMVMNIPQYPKTWQLNYGQALLMKHLIFIPILFFAFINGFLMKILLKKKKQANPLPWAKAESLYVLLIFAATGVLSEQEPPHVIEETLKTSGPSPLFSLFAGNTANAGFAPGFLAVFLFLLSTLFLFLIVFGFKRKSSPAVSFAAGAGFILSAYFGIMLSI
ncbi:CopD family protein [Metabacillus sp. GX 13764]|uniref:copper resistance D family protein n=1 Tax=Metabacillus kandeliae TaxID=2900151 RepID=UPI001E44862A|nr:CopD family protein [Metabacillus kandeliae]MCD7036329.1 CopD family protein [Metabacillus kandeliae]